MKFHVIATEKAHHSLDRLCRCLRVTRSGFYAWATRDLSARAQRDIVLRTKLRAFHAASGHRYGRPNLWKDLQEDGETVSEKRVARLMWEDGIRGKVRRRFKTTTMPTHRSCRTIRPHLYHSGRKAIFRLLGTRDYS